MCRYKSPLLTGVSGIMALSRRCGVEIKSVWGMSGGNGRRAMMSVKKRLGGNPERQIDGMVILAENLMGTSRNTHLANSAATAGPGVVPTAWSRPWIAWVGRRVHRAASVMSVILCRFSERFGGC